MEHTCIYYFSKLPHMFRMLWGGNGGSTCYIYEARTIPLRVFISLIRLQTQRISFLPQIRVDGNNERSVQHSSGGRGGGGGPPAVGAVGGPPAVGAVGGGGVGDDPPRQHQRPIRERGMKKDKQDAPPLVNGVS